MVGCVIAPARGASLNVQNFSFENPVIDTTYLPVSLTADHWMMNGYGDIAYIPGFGTVAAGVGIFPNPSPTSSGHLNGVEGNQAAYIFSNVGNEISQGLVNAGNTNTATAFTAGVQYALTMSLADAQAMPPAGDQLLFQLYYTDNNQIRHQVASRVVNSETLSQTDFADRMATSCVLLANDPAIGKQITKVVIDS